MADSRSPGSSPVPVYQNRMTASRLTLIVTGCIFALLGLTTIILRNYALFSRRRKIGLDDWSMWIAWISTMGFAVSQFISVRYGVGLLVNDVPPQWFTPALKAVYVNEILYIVSICFIKLSLLFLYLRFAPEGGNKFRNGTIIMLAVIITNFIGNLMVAGLQCRPIERYWDPTVPGSCINLTAFFYANNIFTIVSDCIILALPIPTLWKVQRPRNQRAALVATFLIGGVSTVASCIRLYSIRIYTESDQPMRDAAPIGTWSFIEMNLGIVCASGASLKAIFMPATPGDTSVSRSNFADRSQSSANKAKIAAIKMFSFSQVKTRGTLTDGDSDKGLHASISACEDDGDPYTGENSSHELDMLPPRYNVEDVDTKSVVMCLPVQRSHSPDSARPIERHTPVWPDAVLQEGEIRSVVAERPPWGGHTIQHVPGTLASTTNATALSAMESPRQGRGQLGGNMGIRKDVTYDVRSSPDQLQEQGTAQSPGDPTLRSFPRPPPKAAMAFDSPGSV